MFGEELETLHQSLEDYADDDVIVPELGVVLAGHLLLVGKVADDKAGQVGHHRH
jgi:hypothetical protein